MELAIFNFNGSQVRTMEKDGGAWFVAKDVAEILGYVNTRKAVSDHCKHAKPIGSNDSLRLGLDSQLIIIPEGDVFRMAIRSKLPSADKFESWVMDDVLPSIRKTGQYSMRPEILIAHAIIEANKLIENQTALIAEMKPKAEFFDAVTGSHDAVDIGTVAKVLNLGIGRTKLFSFLRDSSILQDNNQPYQKHIDAGHFRVIESSYTKPDGSTHISFKTVVYQKGIDYIRKRYIQEVGHV
jgi:anti-repressor protein